MNEPLYHRNVRALDEAAKADRSRVDDVMARMRVIETQNAMLTVQLAELRQQLTVLLASRGSGPTVRSPA